jgi:predicted RNA-binding Zn ribbon-like protein
MDWLQRAGLLADLDVALPAGKRGALLKAALEMRESARELITRRKGGGLGDPAVLNRVLALGSTHQQLVWKKGQLPTLRKHQKVEAVEAALVPLAEALAKLLTEGDFDLVRQCESADCTLWFYDRTKSHHRRWCSMAMCGNRAKVAAYRLRQKTE